jgi:fibronectin type 3 domain-containing protein
MMFQVPLTVTATWTASPDAAANPTITYNIYRSTSNCNAPNLLKIGSVAAGVLTFQDTSGVVAGNTYCYGVTAVLAGLESAPANGQITIGIASPGNLVLKRP